MTKQNFFKDSKPFSWTNEYLHLILTKGKNCIIKNKFLAEAFNLIDRADFIPLEHQGSAYMDKEIDIGYGCILNKPTDIAQILQFLDPKPKQGNRVLEIGTGSGYVTALLGIACGANAKIITLERVQFLTDIAKLNLSKYPTLTNIKVYLRDGSEGLKEQAPFDYILASVAYETVPSDISYQLNIGGRMIIPTTDKKIHLFERLSKTEFRETIHKLYNFDKIKSGIE
jgi:protein-L-isoaspartate(D-aspartate) O-methyltransferase